MGRIRETYINTGKVRFVYKNFPILGPDSNRAAEASECAAEQDKFWDFHNYIFANQTSEHSPLNDEMLIDMANAIGLDTDAFTECLQSNRYTSQIRQEALSIQSLGVRGTPGFVINGIYIAGAQPFEVFQQVIEEQLQAIEGTSNQSPPKPGPVVPQPAEPPSPAG